MKRIARVGLLGVIAALLLLYVGDLVVLQVRIHRGTGYGVVQVNQFLRTPLKGQKEEFDLMGTEPVTCVRAIFPQPGIPACWWLKRHAAQWE